jgi:hypothetical protein
MGTVGTQNIIKVVLVVIREKNSPRPSNTHIRVYIGKKCSRCLH